jgi:hypothetical protein
VPFIQSKGGRDAPGAGVSLYETFAHVQIKATLLLNADSCEKYLGQLLVAGILP